MVNDIPRSALVLLRTIDAHDQGEGIVFRDAPRGRFLLPGSGGYTVNAVTFRILSREGLIDVGDGHSTTPVKITQAGRDVVTARYGRAKTDGMG